MTTEPTTPLHTSPTMTVVNPTAEPTDAWIAAVARMLLADADEKRERLESEEEAPGHEFLYIM